MTEGENNKAWLHNLASSLYYQMTRLASHTKSGYLTAKLAQANTTKRCSYGLLVERETVVRLMQEQLHGDDSMHLEQAELFWLSALVELHVTVMDKYHDPETTTEIRKRLYRMATKRLNEMYTWMEGPLGSDEDGIPFGGRVFF